MLKKLGGGTYLTSASSTESCAFVNDEQVLNPNNFRQSCSDRCGECCQNSYCGPWLPCEFIDFDSQREELTLENTTLQAGSEKIVHDVNWQKVLEYIVAGYAIVRYSHYRNKDYYFLDVPRIEIEGYRQCGLLSETGCVLDFNHRPIRGAAIGPKSRCRQLPGMRDFQCWTNDPYLFEILRLIYIMQESNELSTQSNPENSLAIIKQMLKKSK